MSGSFNQIVGYCEQVLGLELTETEKRFMDMVIAARRPVDLAVARENRQYRKVHEVVTNAFEEAAAQEPEWKHVPGYAEFEVNRAGDVRNALTKLPLKALGTGTKKQAFMLRADNGIKRMIYKDWIVKQAFPN